MGKVTVFYNCQVIRCNPSIGPAPPKTTGGGPGGGFDDTGSGGDLWVQNGKVICPESVNYQPDKSVDCGGRLIAPGFIDLKLNGAYGVDFASLVPKMAQQQVESVAALLPRTGVTAFCPTIVTSAESYYREVMPRLSKGAVPRGATILGFHMDGPFIAAAKRGAHPLHLVRDYDVKNDSTQTQASEGEEPKALRTMMQVYGELEAVSLVTLAPELPGALDVVHELCRWGIRVSLGHSGCSFAQATAAVSAGATMITHLFNAMPSFHHRDPSLVGLLTANDSKVPYFGLIADGHHTHAVALRMAYRAAPKFLMLVTDGMAPSGLGLGRYAMGERRIVIKNPEDKMTHSEDENFVMCEGRLAMKSSVSSSQEQSTRTDTMPPMCVLANSESGGETLFGSVAPMHQCIRHFMQATGCSLEYALAAASLRPAMAMGIEKDKGHLSVGTDADFVVLEPDTLDVYQTYIAGSCVYESTQ